jgi:hypothetical protein
VCSVKTCLELKVCPHVSQEKVAFTFIEFFSLNARTPAITYNTRLGTAKNWTTKNSKIPHAIKAIPTIFVFLTLKAVMIAPIFIAIITMATSKDPPKNKPRTGIPITLLIKKYKKSPIKGITNPNAAVIIVSF